MNTSERLGGLAGILFVGLTVIGFIIQGDVPVFTDGPATIKEWFSENGDRYLAGWYLIILGLLFYLGFLASLTATFTRVEAAHPWNWVALLGGIHVLVAAQASVAFDGTLALLEGDVTDDVAKTLSAGDYMAFMLTYFFAGILALAVSVMIVRTRMLWAPLAWFGPLVTIGGVVSVSAPLQHDAEGALTLVGYATLVAFLAWTAGVSCALLLTRQPTSVSR
jgi:hypothetical protein